MPLVAGVDSSTQSCKVVIRDAATGALVRSGRAAHPDGTEVDPQHGGARCSRRSPTPADSTTSRRSRSAGSSTAWSCSTPRAGSSATPCSGTTPVRRRRRAT